MLSLSISSMLILLALGVFYAISRYIIYPALFSTLSKIPAAHPTAPWTSLWILHKRLAAGENEAIFQAHRKLGHIVRLGPNEVSANSLEALKLIYVGNFDKHQWFANVGMVNGVPNALSSLDSKSHAESRRLFTNIYSKSYLQNSAELKAILSEVMLERVKPELIQAVTKKHSFDMTSFAAAIGYDLICAYIFGLDAATNLVRDVESRERILGSHKATLPYMSMLGELLGLIEKLEILGIKVIPSIVFEKFNRAIDQITSMTKTAESSTNHKAVVYNHATQAYDKSQLSWPKDVKLTAELFDQVFAGFETISTTIVYLVYEMSRNSHMQDRLRAELRTLVTDAPLPGPREVDQLPLLDAIIQETIRRYPASSTPLARVVPKAGVQLCGYQIPGGVRISSNAYTLHRNAEVFPDPETWNPDRWLNCSDVQLREMKRWFWGFGSGARMCFGIHFALQELKYVAAIIYGEFKTNIVEAGDMTQMDGLSGRPVGDKLVINVQYAQR